MSGYLMRALGPAEVSGEGKIYFVTFYLRGHMTGLAAGGASTRPGRGICSGQESAR